MDQRLRVAVVGLGVGKAHVEAYRQLPEQFALVALCDRDQQRAREVAAAHGGPRVYGELDELCRAGDIDLFLGAFDAPEDLPARSHVWIEARVPWFHADEHLPQHPRSGLEG